MMVIEGHDPPGRSDSGSMGKARLAKGEVTELRGVDQAERHEASSDLSGDARRENSSHEQSLSTESPHGLIDAEGAGFGTVAAVEQPRDGSEFGLRSMTPSTLGRGTLLHETLTKRQKWTITSLVAVASVFSPISATIYVPVIPTIAKSLNKSITAINLSVTSYMLFQGASPSLWGSLADVTGRRPIYLITFAIYVAACIGLSLTTNYAELIVFRCLQSTGSASTIALGAGVIGDITNRRERGGFIGVYSAGTLVGNTIGPVLGGIFAATVGWHGIFYFLTAAAGAYGILLFLILPETLQSSLPDKGERFNLLKRPLLAIVNIDRPLDFGSTTAVRRKVDLLGPIRMMTHRDVALGLVFTALYYTVWQASLVASSSIFDYQYNLSEIDIGLTFLASGVGAVSASLATGRILNYDYKLQRQAEEEAGRSVSASQPPAVADGGRSKGAPALRRTVSMREVKNIEYARLRRIPYVSLAFIGSSFAFGWCVQAHTSIALPILWSFFLSFVTTYIMSAFNTLIVDWYPTKGASATAAINLARCWLGAGGIAVVQPMINQIGVGWTFSVGGFIAIACVPMVVGIMWYARRLEKAEAV